MAARSAPRRSGCDDRRGRRPRRRDRAPLATILAGILVAYGAGAFLAAPRAQAALALGAAGLTVDVLITTRSAADLFFDVVIVGLLPWSMGRMLRARSARERALRESAERLDSERELRVRTAAYAERNRIARELHDVIAHSVSVMVIQAGGARHRHGPRPGSCGGVAALVERAGREALAEMRRLLGVLDAGERPAGARSAARARGCRGAPRADARGRPRDRSRVEGVAAAVSPALDLCAYRIVQEALTNAIKHAGAARARACGCAGRAMRWSSRSCDDGRGPSAVAGRPSGHGIAGMRERAALHGGSVTPGAGADGGFVVRARLPLAAERVR